MSEDVSPADAASSDPERSGSQNENAADTSGDDSMQEPENYGSLTIEDGAEDPDADDAAEPTGN